MKKMNLEDIQELIKFVAKSGATEVDLEFDGIKISIKSPAKKKRGEVEEVTIIQQTAAPIQTVAAPVAAPIAAPKTTETPVSEEKSNYITVKASMIGTFYRSSSPDKPPFVSVGDIIKEGDTICIIEAMKLFNEIESEVCGTIVKVLVDDSSPIEFDQPLFLVDPS
jgi:acetyl-CoA carboxylase biotin carboxyl carrier protein